MLRCHDAFISRYDADGMADLEVHQDTTDFTFTISLNPQSDYDGGGTIFPTLREPELRGSNEPFVNTVVNPDVGCIASFPGRLHHGGNAITSGTRYITCLIRHLPDLIMTWCLIGTRYIIPLFIYVDSNKMSAKPRGYLLDEVGLKRPKLPGLDAVLG